MSMKTKQTVRLGAGFTAIYKRKAGAMDHKLTKRLKTRGAKERKALSEY